ncbi:unnamed protein product [Urochloa decumbens]|uniref:Uncharacterized protein n=1 Tax=Urochloa decumbens TaxID=240449 RepID=A0ABC9F796_9POAL
MDRKKSRRRRRLLHKAVVKLGGNLLSKKFRGKRCGLYIKDIYGTWNWRRDELLKPTLLHQEMVLRSGMYSVKDEYNHLKSIGMLQWSSYKRQEATINRLLQTICRRLDAYKHRRLRTGLFYLCPPPKNSGGHIVLRSPLNHMPLKEALKRRRQDIKRERKILSSYNNKKANATSISSRSISDGNSAPLLKTALMQKERTKSLLLYTVASIFLGCVIVLIP